LPANGLDSGDLASSLSGLRVGSGANTLAGRQRGRLVPTWTALQHRGSGAAFDADTLASGDEAVASGAHSTSLIGAECGTSTFLPALVAKSVLSKERPSNWSIIEHEPGATFADRDIVQVSIQGESERTVILTGVSFQARRVPRPAGSAFEEPCGGPTVGRAIEVDLDATPPRIVGSNVDKDGIIGASEGGHPIIHPIRFPW
jgi:hypothetical protein